MNPILAGENVLKIDYLLFEIQNLPGKTPGIFFAPDTNQNYQECTQFRLKRTWNGYL